MRTFRVIPCLCLDDDYFVKTEGFRAPRYLGDPLNILRIFNEKIVDEIVILDITKGRSSPNFSLLKRLVSQTFVPLSYGGSVRTFEHAAKLINCGFEKIIVGRTAFQNPAIVESIAREFGTQAVIVSIDILESPDANSFVCKYAMGQGNQITIDEAISIFQDLGAGEVLLQDVERDGRLVGQNTKLFSKLKEKSTIPILYGGGVRDIEDMQIVKNAGFQGVSVGAAFVYVGRLNGVLINYPSQQDLDEHLSHL